MKKWKILFVLIACITARTTAMAQQSILPDISENYIARLVAIAEANYPRVKSNQNRINIAQGAIGKARVSYLDAFTFSYVYQPQNFNTINLANPSQSYFNGIQAGLFFNLGNFLEKPYAVRQAREELEIANSDQNEYFLTLTNNVKKRYYTYIAGIAMLKLQTQASLDVQNALNDIKHKFEKGEETFDTFNKAEQNLTVAYQAKIQAEEALLIAKADLEELLGEKLEDVR